MKFQTKLLIFLILVVMLMVGFVVKMVWLKPQTYINSVDTAYEVNDKIMDSDKAIQEYEWFKSKEESIRALYEKEKTAKKAYDEYIAMLPEDKESWDMFDKQEVNRLRAELVGISNILDDAIAEYNARSKMVTRNIWKDNLPSNISRAFYAAKQLTNQ